MSKRNIKPKSGKQLYLNQLFLKGMLYSSSEMSEGYAKTLINFDIAPTGDYATPRKPYIIFNDNNIKNYKYLYATKFMQSVNNQHYIAFTESNLITEEQFAKDTGVIDTSDKGVHMFSRNKNAINTASNITLSGEGGYNPILNSIDMSISTSQINSTITINQNLVYDITDIIETNQPTGYTQYNCDNLVNSDGDSGTFSIYTDTLSFRLIGINCPEANEEWHDFGQKVLYKLFAINQVDEENYTTFYLKFYGRDKYNRKLIRMFVKIKDTSLYLDVNKLMILLGLAKIDYTYENIYINESDTEYIQDLIEISESNTYNMRDENAIDPYYNYSYNIINYPKIDDAYNYHIEIVKLYEQSYPSANITNVIDKVNFIYNDYLDAIGFIGRIINNSNNSILYKGLIYIRARSGKTYDPTTETYNFENINFDLYLPDNDLNGKYINILDATTNGFNIIDSDMIHIEDTNETNKPFSIIGLSVLDPNSEEPIIIDKAIRGQEVRLNTTMNIGYFYNTNVVGDDNLAYNINIEFNNINNVLHYDGNEDNPSLLNKITFEKEAGTSNYTNIIMCKTIRPTVQDVIALYIDKITINIYDKNNNNYFKTITTSTYMTPTDTIKYVDLVDDSNSLIDIKLLIEQRSTSTNSEYDTVQYKLTVFDNLYNTKKIIEPVLDTNNELIDLRTVDRPIERRLTYFFTKWQVSSSDNEWVTVYEPDSYSYHTTTDNNVVVKDLDDDVNWVVDTNGNVSIKYSIQPKIKATTTSNSWLEGLYIENKLQEIYTTIPVFKIGGSIETISKEQLTKNIDIKNATRVGIFNRQVFLYGPYTKSNVLQFSQFEEAWYFPFPYRNIEIEEPITWVTEYNNSIVIFGKHNIWMLTGSSDITECNKIKLYENLSTSITDIDLIKNIGNYIMFFNNNTGYLIVPNQYSDDPKNIKIYKLTENISNLLNNPEQLLRNRAQISYDTNITSIRNTPKAYVQNNEIFIINNYVINSTTKYVLILIYNMDYKYWRAYNTNKIKSINDIYICEPYLNNQFIITSDDNNTCLSILDNGVFNRTADLKYTGNNTTSNFNIICYLESGYLSVDTMNEKRFKDLIFELDNLPDASLTMVCNFYIDNKPILINDTSAVVIDKYNNVTEVSACEYLEFDPDEHSKTIKPVYQPNDNSYFGTVFKINSNGPYYASNRAHIRIPVFGKGRLPSFSLELYSSGRYEFINYSLIYKEKDINIRR